MVKGNYYLTPMKEENKIDKRIIIIKKNGSEEVFDKNKIITACKKAANRVMDNLTDVDFQNIACCVESYIENRSKDSDTIIKVDIKDIHAIVENTLMELYPKTGESYRQYRNYKIDFVGMLDNVYKKSQAIRYIGDVSNANSDSSLVSTQRSLIYGELNKNLYKKFFLNKEENIAIKDGYIYIHDANARLDSFNCMLLDIQNILKGGFEMGNVWYTEPKTLDVAFDVISDIIMSAASQQYGGMTAVEVDKLLSKYARKSFDLYYDECMQMACKFGHDEYYRSSDLIAKEYAMKKVRRDMEQGFQAWEYRFNTVGSSRGDYAFVSITFGLGTDEFAQMATEVCLQTRMNGQGKKGHKRPVLFPKLIFLYDEELHGKGKQLEHLFNVGMECSSKSMYPDWLSLSGEGYVPSMYKKYREVVSPMGCRAFLSPWYIKGGMNPADKNDKPVFLGRCNLGVISLNLPMIYAKAKQDNKDFYEVLLYYLEMSRNVHKRTYEFLAEKKASTNPLCFMQGGMYGGNLSANDKIRPLLKPMTLSFGITALNELQQLHNGKSLVEDGQFALDVMKYINEYVDRIKKEDGLLWAIYGTPAESLCSLQVEQFRKKYGIIQNVSDREYVSNSFHCHVTEDITPIEKQDLENRFWNLLNGGKIQYVRYPISYNLEAQKTLVRRAMKMGLYEGVNLALSYCGDCGYEELNMDKCPKCGGKNITRIDRMNGYLGYTKIDGKSRYHSGKVQEINERVSM